MKIIKWKSLLRSFYRKKNNDISFDNKQEKREKEVLLSGSKHGTQEVEPIARETSKQSKERISHKSKVSNKSYSAVAVSLQGLSHKRNAIVLQDWHYIGSIKNDGIIVAIADGVGSEPFADIGAKIACSVVREKNHELNKQVLDEKNSIPFLNNVFMSALKRINDYAEKNEEESHKYSTTLHIAIFMKRFVAWGSAGDGGIFSLDQHGQIYMLSEPMNGDDGESVIPLTAGPSYWKFGIENGNYQAVLLCTDGVLSRFSSKFLRNVGIEMDKAAILPFIRPFVYHTMNDLKDVAERFILWFSDATPQDYYPWVVKALVQKKDSSEEEIEEFVKNYIFQNNRPLMMLQSIQDDITVVVVQRKQSDPSLRPLYYYLPPDYKKLNSLAEQLLYGEDEDNE